MAQTVRPGAPPCGLYLILPPEWTAPEFLANLRDLFRAINASPYEKNSHVIEFRPEDGAQTSAEQIDILKTMANVVQSQGIVFVVGDDIALAKACGADGVLLNKLANVEAARAMLGDDAIVGLRCAQSRLMAEKALEKGVDYISFHDNEGGFVSPSLVQWWHMKTDNPCLVEGRITSDDCAFYVRAGVDFIDAGSYIWPHPGGVMQGVVNMAYAIDLAAEENEKKAAVQ